MRAAVVVVVAGLSITLLGGCAKDGAPRSAAPEDAAAAPAAEADVAGADGFGLEGAVSGLDELEAEFSTLDRELSANGLAPADDRAFAKRDAEGDASPSKPTAANEHSVELDEDRCTRICELRVAICDVSGRICELAESHSTEVRYGDACERAQARCEQATEACGSCSSAEE